MNRNWSLRLIAFFLPSSFNEVSSNCVAKLTFSRFIDGLEGRFSSSQRELKIQSGSRVVFVDVGLVKVVGTLDSLAVLEGALVGFDEVRVRVEATFII
jgi:uncharacterized protein (UPF0179 family)